MTDVFKPVEELRRHGIYSGGASPATEEIINTLTPEQVQAFIDVRTSPEVQGHSFDERGFSSAMVRAMGWDSPRAQETAEVEGMSLPPVAECACLCTGGGGGSGSSA
ncbi:hypothetical protein ACIBSW_12095 [Actinoplanes sp. NPDC049668]|uniref:hypothetical protein n=1 Tax=unclassified Actinoplanes TaxID=2626549 RepID=UPI0033B235C2